jgi:hypothetical protein
MKGRWNPFNRRRTEFKEEIESHLRMATEDWTDRGKSAEEARRLAIRETGNVDLVSDVTRETWGYLWVEGLARDLKHSLRQLRNSPGFSIAVMGTLALGLGAAAAMFTVVDRVLLRPLPYQDPHALVQILEAGSKRVSWGAPFVDLQQWRSRSHAFRNIAFHQENGRGGLDFLEGRNVTTQVIAPQLSGNLLATLGVHPALGRGFAEDPSSGAVLAQDTHTILLSDAVWRAVFGTDPAILGKLVRLSGQSYTVIGVMPRGFAFPYNASKPLVWTPIVLGDAVNRAFVKEYEVEDSADPAKILGETLLSFDKNRKSEVVGVLDDEHQVSVAEQSQPEIEVCLPQITPDSILYKGAENMAMDIAVRTERDPTAVVGELRAIMLAASPELSSSNFTTMNQVVEDSFGSQQIAARLLEIFGGAALLLCVSGIYGLLAFLVTQRTREVAVRIALGAQRSQVIWLVMKQAVWLLLGGAAAGFLLAYLSSRVLQTLLYGVSLHDPWTFGAVTGVLVISGLTAAYFPARKAAQVDPLKALRAE